MLTHCVFFWANEGLSRADKEDFERGLASLPAIPSVVRGTVGEPAPIDRPVVDRTYSYALMLIFPDRAAHDAYQSDPIHVAFHARCHPYWSKVVAYDFVDRPVG
jgi:hypothetical protein